jgi:hypothetical protein
LVIGAVAARGGEMPLAPIALVAQAQVVGDAIVLADLLPRDVAGRVRRVGEGVLLGRTPQLGAVRQLRGFAVAEAVERGGLRPIDFVIPEVIAVERAGRPMDSREILASIRAEAGSFSLASGAEAAVLAMQGQDLSWDSGLRVPLAGAGLTVQDVSVDLAARVAKFRMVAEFAGGGVAFAVLGNIVRRREVATASPGRGNAAVGGALASVGDATVEPDQAGGRTLRTSEQAKVRRLQKSETEASEDFADLPVLIAAGKTGALWLHSENSSIVVQVQALQAGHAGETIRVRLPLSGKTLRARVGSEGQLEAAF